MNKFVAIALFGLIGVAYAGHHSIVDGDILNRVADVLSHGYGEKVILDYPRKAHLVDQSYSVSPYYGYGGHHGGGGGSLWRRGHGGGIGYGHSHGGHY